MTSRLYDSKFHQGRNEATRYAAQSILAHVFNYFPQIKSVVDFGCGVGTWVNTAKDVANVDRLLGIEGPWLDRDELVIAKSQFLHADLGSTITLDERYDLAISLEVAEHISSEKADIFVDNLAAAADTILFSAAHPDQGGVGHVNEQWMDYWIDKFEARGYISLDLVRPYFYGVRDIPYGYKSNCLIFARSSSITASPISDHLATFVPPEKYLLHYKKMSSPGIRRSIKNLNAAISKRFF